MCPTNNGENVALAVHRCEPGAFDRLVDRFEASLFNYANRILGNAFDAQEVVQDAFLRAHEALTRRYDFGRLASPSALRQHSDPMTEPVQGAH